jgi:hypothetical protein
MLWRCDAGMFAMSGMSQTPWKVALVESGFPDAKEEDLKPLFKYVNNTIIIVIIIVITMMRCRC